MEESATTTDNPVISKCPVKVPTLSLERILPSRVILYERPQDQKIVYIRIARVAPSILMWISLFIIVPILGFGMIGSIALIWERNFVPYCCPFLSLAVGLLSLWITISAYTAQVHEVISSSAESAFRAVFPLLDKVPMEEFESRFPTITN